MVKFAPQNQSAKSALSKNIAIRGKMSVIEEIEEFIKSMPVGYEFSRNGLKQN